MNTKGEFRSSFRMFDQKRDVSIESFARFGVREKELVLVTERRVVVVREEESLDPDTFPA